MTNSPLHLPPLPAIQLYPVRPVIAWWAPYEAVEGGRAIRERQCGWAGRRERSIGQKLAISWQMLPCRNGSQTNGVPCRVIVTYNTTLRCHTAYNVWYSCNITHSFSPLYTTSGMLRGNMSCVYQMKASLQDEHCRHSA